MGSEEHDCERFAVQDFESREWVCIKCGNVVKEDPTWFECLAEHRGPHGTNSDHQAGNDLYNSITPQVDFISFKNPGLAFELNNTKLKDAGGQTIKKQLHDPYWAGNVAGKAMVVREDPLTGEKKLCFSMYEKGVLPLIKERATEEVSKYRFNTVEQTIIANHIKKICSRLVITDVVEYCWIAGVLNADLLKEKDAVELQKKLIECIDKIRLKLLTRCDTNQVKVMKQKEEAAIKIPTTISAR